MNSFTQFEKLKSYASEMLSGEALESFTSIFEFCVWLACVMLAVCALLRLSPLKHLVYSYKNEFKREYRDSDIMMLFSPSGRRKLHWINLFTSIAFGLVMFLASYVWANFFVMSFLLDSLLVNRFTAIFILGGLTVLHFFIAVFVLNDANKVARHIRLTHT